ncbi:hypothetical protein ACFZB9_08495 [Kitasatospora sp. NPDC008050]|uniref:hypothetical protein n=1 Tax=Kitasatospora sp. NPDC008050 TaxID=3364021 RepID=UPI0036EB2F4D
MPYHHALLGSIAATLREAGLPLADQGGGAGGVVLSRQSHGVTVSWQTGPQGSTVDPLGAGVTVPARALGAAAIRSRHFRVTLRLAALLAEAGYHSEHTGDRVLISNPTGC